MEEEGEGAGRQVNMQEAKHQLHAPAHLLAVHLGVITGLTLIHVAKSVQGNNAHEKNKIFLY